MTRDIAYLRDLLAMCERSPQYIEGPHWAVATVSRLREELRNAEEHAAGIAMLRKSQEVR